MSKSRVSLLVKASLLGTVILVVCAFLSAQAKSFTIQSQKTKTVYGPFVYANEVNIVTGPSSFTLVIDEEMLKNNSFKIKSLQTGRLYGPFECKVNEDIVIGKSIFTIVDID